MFVFVLLITLFASLFGALIPYWTGKEMTQYLKWIKYSYLIFLLLVTISLFLVMCTNCVASVISILLGIGLIVLFDWFIFKKEFGESSTETWLLVGIALATLFSIDFKIGILTAYFVSLHNMFYASLNLMKLKGKSIKKFLSEQALYFGAAIVAFYLLSKVQFELRYLFSLALFGVFMYLFVKKAIKTKS